MAITQYCWRCKKSVSMLDENEWSRIEPLLTKNLVNRKIYRQTHQASITESINAVSNLAVLNKYLEITGTPAANISDIWHHRLSLFGAPCQNCGQPLRTPQASFCANCGLGK
jgi:hypothetical protein